jgi:hypothetical protein
MTADLANPFVRAVLEGARPRTATAKISRDGRWIRCNHPGCHQALGTVSWGPYPAVDFMGEIVWPHMTELHGTVPYRLLLLDEGWAWRAGTWQADARTKICMTQRPPNHDLIGSGGAPIISVWSPQAIDGWAGAGQSKQPLWVQTQAGLRTYHLNPANLLIDPPVDQLGYSLEQFPEMSQVVECARCRALVAVDLAALSRELRPIDWQPGTKYPPV